jgi:hypothetical protein
MALLSREAIVAVDDLKIERVTVPEWGGEVLIRTMNGLERSQFDSDIIVERNGERDVDKQRFFSELLSRTLVGEEGSRLFASPEEVRQLMGKSGEVLTRLGQVALRINGLSRESQEEITKNSEPAPNGASHSA